MAASDNEEVNLTAAKNMAGQAANELEELVLSQGIFAGRFDVAKTTYALTREEQQAREAWNQARGKFLKALRPRFKALPTSVWDCTNLADIVSSSIVPPMYSTGPTTTSQRSKVDEQRNKRFYPLTIEKWDDFTDLFDMPFETTELTESIEAPFFTTIIHRATVTNESSEQNFLNATVFTPFSGAGLMCLPFQLGSNRRPTIGKPDETCYRQPNEGSPDKAQITAVFEAKALQNMLLPNDFETLKEKFEAAVKHQIGKRKKSRSKNWSQICHPLAQEIAYMVDNGVRYGALFCASKAYFIHLEGSNRNIENVKITDAYIAGEKNFLRAWACLLRLANASTPTPSSAATGNDRLEIPGGAGISWLQSTPIDNYATTSATGIEEQDEHHDEDDDDDEISGSGSGNDPGGSGGDTKGSRGGGPPRKKQKSPSSPRSQKKQGKQTAVLPSPPRLTSSGSAGSEEGNTNSLLLTPPDFSFSRFDFEEGFVDPVDFQTLEIGQLLGVGRNGDVFESSYNGEKVAVKQFDLSKNFDSYKREVAAYMHLSKGPTGVSAWGRLVPTPKFIAQSPSGVVRFLGLQKGRSPEEGDDFGDQFDKVIGKLRTEYDFQPLDYSHGCNVIIVPEDNEPEKLLIIDLEFWKSAS